MPSFSRNAGLHIALPLVAGFIAAAPAQPAGTAPSGKAILVTPDNFARQESDLAVSAGLSRTGALENSIIRANLRQSTSSGDTPKSRHALLGGGFRS